MNGMGRQLATFSVEDLLFGVDVLDVREVLLYQQMTRVPLASSVIEGLINLRGQIVTALDLRRCLGMRDRQADTLPMNVVVNCRSEAVSLLVDDIGDVLDVRHDSFEPPPATLPGRVRQVLSGVYKLDRKLLLVLDIERAADVH